MTNLPEAKLAREAEMAFATMAFITDYDCWKTDEAPGSWDDILEIFNQNAHNVVELIKNTVPKIQ